MKELSIEEKAKRYDEALENAKHYHNEMGDDVCCVLEECFPELNESEDYKWIPREIVSYLKEKGDYRSCWIAWLEKQCEQKPVTIDIHEMVDNYANNYERGHEEFGKPTNCMIRAYKQGLNDAIEKVVLDHAWSEEDERILKNIIINIKNLQFSEDMREKYYHIPNTNYYQIMIDWLESLKNKIR